MRRIRSLAAVALVAMASPFSTLHAIELEPVPTPPLAQAEEAVRVQLEESRKRLDLRLQGEQDEELGEAFGEIGMLYLNYGFLAAARASFENASALRPDDFRWPYYLGALHQERGQLEDAAAYFEQTLRLREGDLPTVLRLAEVTLGLNRVEEAQALFEAALQSPVGLAAGHAGLGRIALDQGQPEKAIEHLKAALADQPQADSLHHSLGLAYREIGELDLARSHLELAGDGKVISPDPLRLALDALATGAGSRVMEGVAAYRDGQFEEAAAAYRAAIEANPNNLEARRALAATLEKLDDTAGAIEQYRALLAADPNQALPHYSLGTLLLKQLDFAAAERSLERAVELQPDFADAWMALGEVEAHQGEIAAASRHFARVVELDPRSAPAHLRLSRTLRTLGQTAEADRQLAKLLELEPHNVDGLLLAAQNAVQDGRPEVARQHLEQVLQGGAATRPQLAQTHFLLGTSETESLEERIAALRKAVEYGPRHVLALFNLATSLAQAGQAEEAVRYFKDVVTLTPEDQSARYRLAVLLAEQGERWDALAQFEKLRQERPEHLEFTVRSARLLAELGDMTAAAQRLQDGLEVAPTAEDRSRLYGQLADLAHQQGETERVFQFLQQAVQAAPEFPPPRRALAEAFGRAKRYQESVEAYDRYLALAPGDEGAHFARATALILDQNFAAARASLEASLEQVPQSVLLGHLLARLLAAAPEEEVRDGERALALATSVFQAQRDPAHGETVAMSLAALGRFEEALSWQRRLLDEAEKVGLPDGFKQRVQENLARYESGQQAEVVW